MATHDVFLEEPVPPAPKSSNSKVLLILVTIIGLGLAVCGGVVGLAYFYLKDMVEVTKDSAEVKVKSREIVEIDLPEDYAPISAGRLSLPGGISMKGVLYQVGTSNQGVLMLMEMNQPGDPKQMREQMLQHMRSQQAGAGGMNNGQIVPETTETKMFEINGESVEFDFVKGTRPGDPTVYRQVTGTFAGRQGTVLLLLLVPDSEYKEEEVKKMISSIRIPGKTAGSDAQPGTESTHVEKEAEAEMHETEGKEPPAREPTPESPAQPETTE